YLSGWGGAGQELWRIEGRDGTPIHVADAAPYQLLDVGGALLGINDDAQLWRYQYGPLRYVRYRAELAAFERRTVFSEPQYDGLGIGTSGGTEESSVLLQRLARPEEGVYDSYDCEGAEFTRAGERVFFRAHAGDVGCELWALPLDALSEVCVDCVAPTATPTRPPATPTPTCADNACTQVIGSQTSGTRGETVTIDVSLRAQREPIAGIENEIHFSPRVAIAAGADGQPECSVNLAIDKAATAFVFRPHGCRPGRDCSGVQALVLSFSNVDPIADGALLYSCTVEIGARAAFGRQALPMVLVGAATTDGEAVDAIGVDAGVTVLGGGVAGAHNASGDGCHVAAPGRSGWMSVVPWLLIAAALWPPRPRAKH
ncbi:MAG TPA: hypothetical protein VGC36_17315, partial [Rhizomicrobium sp.]